MYIQTSLFVNQYADTATLVFTQLLSYVHAMNKEDAITRYNGLVTGEPVYHT